MRSSGLKSEGDAADNVLAMLEYLTRRPVDDEGDDVGNDVEMITLPETCDMM